MPNGSGPRMTLPTQLVLRVLLEDPTAAMYGLAIGQAAELPSGTVHPILARLESAGWLTSEWETLDPHEEGRPRRRYYRLTPDGTEMARNALERAVTGRRSIARLRPGLAETLLGRLAGRFGWGSM